MCYVIMRHKIIDVTSKNKKHNVTCLLLRLKMNLTSLDKQQADLIPGVLVHFAPGHHAGKVNILGIQHYCLALCFITTVIIELD